VSVSRNEADLRSVSCPDDWVRGRLYAFVSGRNGQGAGRAAKVYTRSGNDFTVSVRQREYRLAASAYGTGSVVRRAVACGGRWKARCLSTASNEGMTLAAQIYPRHDMNETTDNGNQ
jgi:hypothetical protein